MNIVLITLGTDGDVDPFIALGRELKNRGHSVTLVSNDYFKPIADKFEFGFVSIGTKQDYMAILENQDVWTPRKGFKLLVQELILRHMRTVYKLMASLFTADTVMVAPSFMFGARIVRDKLGVPLVTVVLQPASIWSYENPPPLASYAWAQYLPAFFKRALAAGAEQLYFEPLLAPETNRFRSELGLPQVAHVSTRWLYSPDRIIALYPDWFGPALVNPPSQLIMPGFVSHESPGKEAVPSGCSEFLSAGDPPIVFTPGSGHQHARDFFKVAADACRILNKRGLFLTKFRAHLPSRLPNSIYHCEYAPFLSVFPLCETVVHHGGIGTTAKAMASAIPQLVMPMAYDQPDNARRVKILGVSRFLPPKQFLPENLAHELNYLISSNEVKAQCLKLSRRINHSAALQDACSAIESVGNKNWAVARKTKLTYR